MVPCAHLQEFGAKMLNFAPVIVPIFSFLYLNSQS